jgi:hypothetical protein
MRGPSRPATPSTRRRPRAKKVRVVAVRHPPRESVAEEILDEKTLYITDASVAEWFRDTLGVPPRDDKTVEQIAADGTKLLEFFGNKDSVREDNAAIHVLALMKSEMARDLMTGAFRGSKNNPLFAMDAFLVHHAAGLYPPLWVLDWLNDAFGAFLKSGGKKDLAALLGAKRGQGQRPIFLEVHAIDEESAYMHEIALLNAVGVSIEEAGHMVFARYEAAGHGSLAAETLASRFTKHQWRGYAKILKDAAALFPREQLIAEMKSVYPPHSWPNRWK